MTNLEMLQWDRISPDPNGPEAVTSRARVLDNAWRTSSPAKFDPRVSVLTGYAAGKRVLDIGCVEHSAEMVDPASGSWLHARVRANARECVGVDVEAEGIEKMNSLGFEAVCHDLTDGPGPLADEEPFEVAIAGELIEHIPNPAALLAGVRELLVPGGRVVFSTPNPYAPWRVRAGQLRRVYESVDHVAYLFPSGMAELGSRSGFVLEEAFSVHYPTFERSVRETLAALWHRARGRTRKEPQLWPLGLPLPDAYVSPWQWLRLARRRRKGWLGEHAIYVLRKAGA